MSNWIENQTAEFQDGYDYGYQQGRADVIDECIKIVNKAYYDNDSLKMIVKYFEQLKEQNTEQHGHLTNQCRRFIL